MFNLSGSEIVVILLLALVVLGPEKLPDAIRRFGRAYGEIRRMSRGFQSEFKQAFDEPVRELRETARLTKEAVAGIANDGEASRPAPCQPEPGSPAGAAGPIDADTPRESRPEVDGQS